MFQKFITYFHKYVFKCFNSICVINALQRNNADYFFQTITDDEVDCLGTNLDILKEGLHTFFGTTNSDLKFKLKSTEMKINNMNRELFVKTGSRKLGFNQAKKLAERFTEISNIVVQMRQMLIEGNLVFELSNKKVHNYYDFIKKKSCLSRSKSKMK